MRYISAYTVNTIYEEHIKKLKLSFEKFNLDYKFYSYEDRGDWKKNCAAKSEFILQALEEFKCPIVWIDADAEVNQNPSIFSGLNNYDIAFRSEKNALMSGTLWFDYNETSTNLVKNWVNTCKEYDYLMDQVALDVCLADFPNIRVFNLPVEYLYIQNLTNYWHGNIDPVITHFKQSSEIDFGSNPEMLSIDISSNLNSALGLIALKYQIKGHILYNLFYLLGMRKNLNKENLLNSLKKCEEKYGHISNRNLLLSTLDSIPSEDEQVVKYLNNLL